MANIRINVVKDIRELERLERCVKRFPQTSDRSNPIRKAFRQVAKRYEVETLRNFDRASRGGMDWPALSQTTVRHRAKPAKRARGARNRGASSSLARNRRGRLVSAGRSVSIMKDTGTLRNSLRIDSPGNDTKDLAKGISYGFAKTPHPGGPSISQLAAWHQSGAGHNPVRRILREPSPELQRKAIATFEKALRECAEG